MHTIFTMTALCACALCLGACDKAATPPATTAAESPRPIASGATAGSADDPSVPSAGSVLPPATTRQPNATQGRSNDGLSATQESAAMPLPGQNNDHSAPLEPAKRASSP